MMRGPGWKGTLTWPPLDCWSGFFLATLGIMFGVAAFEFIRTAEMQFLGSRALHALQWASMLVLAALTCGFIVWMCMRVFRGKNGAPEPKESVLWSASIIVIAATAARLLR